MNHPDVPFSDPLREYPGGPLAAEQHPAGYVCWKCGVSPKDAPHADSAVAMARRISRALTEERELREPTTNLEARLLELERPVDDRDAIAWEIGRSAGIRGDSEALNPFRNTQRCGR